MKSISLSKDDIEAINNEIEAALDYVQFVWDQSRDEFVEASQEARVPIAKHFLNGPISLLTSGELSPLIPRVEETCALVVDMRDSTKHLVQSQQPNFGHAADRLMRVHAETAALIAAGSILVKRSGGITTELLGDGHLSIYLDIGNNCSKGSGKVVAAAVTTAEKIILARQIINDHLDRRFSIPAIDYGVGTAFSKAVVAIVGSSATSCVKVIGECVFRATKLADGVNCASIDVSARAKFPKSKGGTIKFIQRKDIQEKAYYIDNGQEFRSSRRQFKKKHK